MRNSKRLALIVMLIAAPILWAGEPATESHSLEIVLTGKVEMILDGEAVKIESITTMSYTNKRTQNSLKVFCNALKLVAKNNGSTAIDFKMDKTGLIGPNGNVIYSAENGTDSQKNSLQQIFEQPIATIELDDDGKEVQRIVSKAPDAQAVLQTGVVQNVRLFHLPYLATKKAWPAKIEISAGSGGMISGEIEVEKTTLEGNQQSVKVSGTLSRPSYTNQNNMTVKDLVYEINGTQTYDLSMRDWVAGSWTAKIKFGLSRDGLVGSAVGDLHVEFKTQK